MPTMLDSLATALDAALLFEDLVGPPDPWQASVLRSSADRVLMLCARQLGKSTCVAVLALHTALYEPGSLTLIASPTARQSGLLFRKVLRFWRAMGRPVGAEEETATMLALRSGSCIASLPGSAETIRGFSDVRLVVVDEAAQVPDEMVAAVSPMLGVSRGRLVGLSTPYGQRGWFYEAWHDASPLWERHKVTAMQCGRIDRAWLERERRLLGPRWWSQEYDCAFVSTIDQVFSTESVLAAFTSTERPLFSEAT